MPTYLENRLDAQGSGAGLAGKQARVSRPEVVLVLGVAPWYTTPCISRSYRVARLGMWPYIYGVSDNLCLACTVGTKSIDPVPTLNLPRGHRFLLIHSKYLASFLFKLESVLDYDQLLSVVHVPVPNWGKCCNQKAVPLLSGLIEGKATHSRTKSNHFWNVLWIHARSILLIIKFCAFFLLK